MAIYGRQDPVDWLAVTCKLQDGCKDEYELFESIYLVFPTSPITSHSPCFVLSVSVCVSPLITCAIITSRALLPCDLTLVDFGNLDDCFV